MRLLRALFTLNLIVAGVAALAVPVMLLVSVGSPARLLLVGATVLYIIASIWLMVWGKRNRLTACVAIATFAMLLAAGIGVARADKQRAEEQCSYLKTKCAKMDAAGIYYCGATDTQEGAVVVTHVPPQCLPSKEQSCSYAKQFCKVISLPDSTLTHYKCDHETISCPN